MGNGSLKVGGLSAIKMHLWSRDMAKGHGGTQNILLSKLPTTRNAQFQDLGEGTMNSFERIIGGSADSGDTHKSAYFQVGIAHLVEDKMNNVFPRISDYTIADPFARNCMIGTHTNDIDQNTKAIDHMDALVWLKTQEDQYFDSVIFDPPFSEIMADRKYLAGHVNIYTVPGYVSECFTQITRILKPGGKVLKLGYNSTRHHPLLDLKKGWIICFGGNRNDVIMTLWQKNQFHLEGIWE